MRLLVMGWMLILLWSLVPRQTATNSANGPAIVTSKGADNREVSASSLVQEQPAASTSEQESNNPAVESEPRHVIIDSGPGKDAWDKVYICLTAILVFIGALTLVAIWFQAKQTKVAAGAARLNAIALINQNRPWIILAKETTVPKSPPEDWTFNVAIENYGKTPARIIWLKVDRFVGPSSDTPPDTSIFTTPSDTVTFMLPPGQALQWKMRLPLPSLSKDILNNAQFLWLCGVVIYSEAVELEGMTRYESTFCYFYQRGIGTDLPAWRRGPREYNRTT